MKLKNLRRATLALIAILSVSILPLHALTVTCFTNKTVECDSGIVPWDPPTGTNGCCTNITVSVTYDFFFATNCTTTHIRSWLVSDCCTNFTCSQTITVVDTTPPVISCASNKTVQCGSQWAFDPPIATDACCGTNLNYWFLGSNLVSSTQCQTVWAGRWQVSDCCTNYSPIICTQLVTVKDLVFGITAPTNLTVFADAGQCSRSNVVFTVSALGNCSLTNLVSSPPSGSTFPVGTTMVTSTAKYACGEVINWIWPVKVVDADPPTIICPTNLILTTDAGQCSRSNVTFIVTATDNCGLTNFVTIPPSGSTFPVGTTIVYSTARDANGNAAVCSFQVKVTDNQNPVITCPTNLVLTASPGLCSRSNVTFTVSATDNCSVTNLVSSPPSGSTFPVGTTTVTNTATDSSGNTSTCTFTVTVTDNQSPVLTCASNKTIQCGSALSFDPPGAQDNCCPSNSLVYWFLGSNVVSSTQCQTVWAGGWRVSDCWSNFTTCTQLVQVVDNIAPVFTVLPSNMVFNCTCAGGNNVSYTVSAVDNCETNIAVICTPPSGSRFPVGTNLVTCTARDTCGNETNYFFTITILSNCPVYNCINIQCPGNIRLPCDGFDNTLVNWTVTASNSCSPGNVVTWSDPPSPALFGLGTHPVTCYASNTVLCEVQTCQFTVEIFPRGPRLSARRGSGTFGTNSLLIDYAQSCGEFAIEWIPGAGSGGSGGGSGWSPISGLPTGSWGQPNQTNNAVDRIIRFVIPDPSDPSPFARFFRLNSDPEFGKDFSSVAPGQYTNAVFPGNPWITFSRLGLPGQLQVMDFSVNQRALVIDDVGIVADFSVNNSTWPNRLYGSPVFHEAEVRVIGHPNEPETCWFAEAFDTTGQMVEAYMTTNTPATLILRSVGYPLHHIKLFTEPNESVGLVSLKARTDYTLPIDQPGECLDFRAFATNTVVPNPWVLPGHTIASTNALGIAEPSTYIEAGPDGYGNGYHVQYSTTIHLTTNCCRHIQVELIKHAGPVQVSAYDESGTELASHVVTVTGTPYTVDFPPTSSPICKLVVTSPDDQTRILRICCLPALQQPPPPYIPPPGTNSNPLVVGTGAGTVSFQVSGGLLGPLVTYSFMHGIYTNHAVLDLGMETVATLATPCTKVVFEVISQSNTGMELEAADQFGFVVSRAGPLASYAGLQTVVLSGQGITTVRFKNPNGQGSLANIYWTPFPEDP